ncbi:threonylcarbamoyl-AMP synthase [Candidatus Woesearchaeota archaeon]|jgi:L-threonylcarbamoyladenylate synthase|nr:threonylcarbamoyl-AMP synthase [Candidatus Woesearchaeota archaeon]
METLTKTEVKKRFDEIINWINKGAIFIYPTDTIYGIGCITTNDDSVKKINQIKQREGKPLSVWVPNKEWISTNCIIPTIAEEWLDKLPGSYTFIFNLKDQNVISKNVSKEGTIGVRLPNHWFNNIVSKLKSPIITTSVNKAGEMFMTDLENLDPDIQNSVDFLIYEGEKKGKPSKIINFVTGGNVLR